VFIGFSYPFYYPAYYYSYPPPYYAYDYPAPPPATYSAPSTATYDRENVLQGSYVDQDTQSYYSSGRDWGQDLRRDVVGWDRFVAYLKGTALSLSQTQLDEFRRGFVEGYGNRGNDALDKAMKEAVGPEPSQGVPPPPSKPGY
jgi:hypothetical protein